MIENYGDDLWQAHSAKVCKCIEIIYGVPMWFHCEPTYNG